MRVCVFGASSTELDKSYTEAGEELGRELARRGHSLVFGGGANGLMGAVVRGATEQGGYSIGVTPRFFDVDGIVFHESNELIYTDTMRERKYIMEEKAEAFVMVPGGIGTFEEFFETLTLKQLGVHRKAIAIYDVNGYYAPLLAMLEKAVEEKFMTEACQALYFVSADLSEVMNYIETYVPRDLGIFEFKHVHQEGACCRAHSLLQEKTI